MSPQNMMGKPVLRNGNSLICSWSRGGRDGPSFDRRNRGGFGALLIGPEFDLMQGRYDLFTNQLDGAHHVFMGHVALVPVTDEVARGDSVQDSRQPLDYRVGITNYDAVRLLKLLIGPHLLAQPNSYARWDLPYNLDRSPRPVSRRIVVFRRALETVFSMPHVGTSDFLRLLIGVGAEHQDVAPKVSRPGREASLAGGLDIDGL